MTTSKSKPGATQAPPEQPAAAPPAEVEFELSLEDTLAMQNRGLLVKGRKGTGGGCNPYDNGDAPPPNAPRANAHDPKRKPTDLRKLSEWIRLQRQVEALKKDDTEPEQK